MTEKKLTAEQIGKAKRDKAEKALPKQASLAEANAKLWTKPKEKAKK